VAEYSDVILGYRMGWKRWTAHEIPMKYISLHVAVHHPLITINQSFKVTLGRGIGSILCASGIYL